MTVCCSSSAFAKWCMDLRAWETGGKKRNKEKVKRKREKKGKWVVLMKGVVKKRGGTNQ